MGRSFRRTRTSTLLAVAVITLIGFALRVRQIGHVPLWGDEAQTVAIVHWPYWDLLTQPIDPSGGFYYSLHKALIPDGASAALSRSLSLIAGVVAIPLTYVAARLAIGLRGALLAAMLVALSRPLMDYSQEDRAYSVLVLLILMSAIGLLRWGHELAKPQPNGGPLLLFAGAVVLAQYTHLVAFFWSITAFHAVISATTRRGSRRAKRLVLTAAASSLLLLVPEACRLLSTVLKVGVLGWLPQASFGVFLQTLADTWLPIGIWNGLPFPATVGTIILLIAALTSVTWGWLHREHLSAWSIAYPFGATVVGGLLLFPLFVWLFGFIFSPIYMQRTILPSVLGFSLFLALVASQARGVFSILLVIAYALSTFALGTIRDREPWSRAVRELSSRVRAGDAIIVCPTWKYPALRSAALHALPAPVYVLRRGQVLKIEDRLGSNPAWADTFYRAILRDQYRINLKVRQTWRGEPGLVPRPSRIWLIESQCSADERRAVDGWSGVNRWRTISTLGSDRGRTRVSIIVADQPPVTQRAALRERPELPTGRNQPRPPAI